MKKIALFITFCAISAWVLGQDLGTLTDPKISFNFVSKDVDGTIGGFTSSSKIDATDITRSTFKGSVRTETLDSGNFLRNWSLKGGKYFDVDTHPTMSFESTGVKGNFEQFEVEGVLDIKGIVKPVSITFTKEGNRLKGTATIYASDFGIQVMKKSREANKVVITMSFTVR